MVQWLKVTNDEDGGNDANDLVNVNEVAMKG